MMKPSLRWRLFWWHVALLFMGSALTATLSLRDGARARRPANDSGGNISRGVVEAIAESFLPLLAISVFSYIMISRRAVRPILGLTQAAERIADGNFKERVQPDGTSPEVDQLIAAFNRMAEQLEASFRRIHDFTLNASHELKTPLTILRADFEKMLGDSKLPPRHYQTLENCTDEVDRLARILSGLTLLLRAESNDLPLERAPVNLAELVRESADEAEVLGQGREITSLVERCDPCNLQGDRGRLRQLLLNLTDNAVKYNEPGGRVIYRLINEGVRYRLEVANAGHPIPSDELPRLFDRFYRSRASRGSGMEGCGLGLSIAQWIAGAHGGEITARSENGVNIFTAVLPAHSSSSSSIPIHSLTSKV